MGLPKQEHGRTAWLRNRCRCDRCGAAMRNYSRTYQAVRALERGRSPATRVSTLKAAKHLAELMATGMSMRAIARAAGVSETTVWRIAHGRLRCSVLVSSAILAVVRP